MFHVLSKKLPGAEFVDGQQVMIQVRMVKTAEKITCMKMGYVIFETGMQSAPEALKPGGRECERVGVCFQKFWELGSDTV